MVRPRADPRAGGLVDRFPRSPLGHRFPTRAVGRRPLLILIADGT